MSNEKLADDKGERSYQRLQLLGDVSDLLSQSLDTGTEVTQLAELVVPALADWCTVTLIQTGRLSKTLGWSHSDPEKETMIGEYAKIQAASMNDKAAIAVCLRTGEEVHVLQVPPLETWVEVQSARDMLQLLNPQSVSVFPLKAGSVTLGAMALVKTTPGETLSDLDIRTARDVARRAGLALDNARLYAQQLHMSEALQRSLLTNPPPLAHIEVATRYVTAAQEAKVGGDWYDALNQRDGTSMLVIGDVVGHDSQAAAVMGQLRGLLRGIAYTTNDGPVEVLTDLDEAIAGLHMTTSATAVVASFEKLESKEPGVLMRWSNAGHPPPMVVTPSGVVTTLGEFETDILLGVVPDIQRSERSLVLEPKTTVVFYTDGLVEQRGLSLDKGLKELAGHLTKMHQMPIEQLCNELIDQMVTSENDDDVVILVARVR